MANPQQRGLPVGFGIKVAAPVSIGDYLDDEPKSTPAPTLPKRTPPQTAATQPVIRETSQSAARQVPKVQEPAFTPAATEPDLDERLTPSTLARKNPPRKQINMRPDTIKKAEEMVRHIQTFSVQKDTKASEVFDALVELLHDAKKQMDLSSVPPRGQWGSPTAKSFRTMLKNAFAKAIVNLEQAKENS